MSIELISAVTIGVLLIQSLILALLIFGQRKRGNVSNYLVLMLVFFILSQANVTVYYILGSTSYKHWIPYFHLELLLGLGPAMYVYTKSLTDRSYRFSIRESIHFLPASLEFIYYRTSWFREGAIPLSQIPETFPHYLFQSIQWAGVISVSLYLVCSLRLLYRYRGWVSAHYSTLDYKGLSWHEKPLISYTLFWFIWISIRLSDIYLVESAIPFYFNAGFIALSVLTCFISFNGYIKSQQGVEGFLNSRQMTRNVQGCTARLRLVAEQIKESVEDGRLYLDCDFSLTKLSEAVDFSEREISQALNACLKMNFHEFVNRYRVESVKEKMDSGSYEHLSLLGIALESGFGSKSTFNLVFKSQTGMTPRQYKDTISDHAKGASG